MTTYSAITDAGMVADGHYVIDTFTMPNDGGYHLTCPTAVFGTAGVGDHVMVGEALAGAQGGAPLVGTVGTSSVTIASIDANLKGIVLAVTGTAMTQALSSLANTVVAWGHTNNVTPLKTFIAAHVGETGAVLNFPSSGIFFVGSGNAGGLFGSASATGATNLPGFKSITVNGNNSTICGGTFNFGSGGQLGTANNEAFVASCYKGATSVTCTTAAHASRFTVGQYAMMSGIAMQYGGFPTNHQVYEYVLISAVNAGTGLVTFATTPLRYNYLSTWPVYDAATTTPRFGGAAMLYAQDSAFDHTAVINDLTIAHHAQWAMNGLDLTLNNVAALGLYGPYCTMSKRVQMNTCTGIACSMEIDKYIEEFGMAGCDWGSLTFQSGASPQRCVLDSTTVRFSITGVPYDFLIQNNCSIGVAGGNAAATISMAPDYGHARRFRAYDSVFQNWGSATVHEQYARYGSVLNVSTGFEKDAGVTMVGGMLTIPKGFYGGGASGGNGYFEKWPQPGAQFMWYDYNSGRSVGPSFRIVNVTQDANNTYIFTDWTGNNGGFPNRSYGANGLQMYRLTCLETTVRNCTGCPEIVDMSGAPAGKPTHTYTNRSYDGSVAVGPYWPVHGRIKKIVVTVPTAWTVSGPATATILYGGLYSKMSDQSDYAWAPIVDLKAAGTRSLLTNTSLNWSATFGADSLPNLAQQTWVQGLYPVIMTDDSGQAANLRPAFTVEIETDQNVAPLEVVPLRMRMHA